MCIPHGALGGKSNGFEKEDKVQKHIKRVSQEQFEKGDPNFIDERIISYSKKDKESFFNKFFKLS